MFSLMVKWQLPVYSGEIKNHRCGKVLSIKSTNLDIKPTNIGKNDDDD